MALNFDTHDTGHRTADGAYVVKNKGRCYIFSLCIVID